MPEISPWTMTALQIKAQQRTALVSNVNALDNLRNPANTFGIKAKEVYEAEYQSAILELNAFDND